MHFLLSLWCIFAVWKWADWRNWEKYHTVMLYMALGNLTYNFLTYKHWLWKLKPDVFPDHVATEIAYTFIIFPATALLYLSKYPEGQSFWKQVRFMLRWVTIYVGMELIGAWTGRIIYQYGWNLAWSAFFDCIMFPMLRLYQVRPLLAYIISVGIATFFLMMFDIPLKMY
ncbi:CBO0543 family protein [Brevibacillus dissolubilis]|uniref:CBO0543 family protein n=1 Tax=Brevibacillus dissolubilis TaxID=1844116 RepID=UPI001116433A|nr:CBO0543 family protein [Brevibacillus dissolubilis]